MPYFFVEKDFKIKIFVKIFWTLSKNPEILFREIQPRKRNFVLKAYSCPTCRVEGSAGEVEHHHKVVPAHRPLHHQDREAAKKCIAMAVSEVKRNSFNSTVIKKKYIYIFLHLPKSDRSKFFTQMSIISRILGCKIKGLFLYRINLTTSSSTAGFLKNRLLRIPLFV